MYAGNNLATLSLSTDISIESENRFLKALFDLLQWHMQVRKHMSGVTRSNWWEKRCYVKWKLVYWRWQYFWTWELRKLSEVSSWWENNTKTNEHERPLWTYWRHLCPSAHKYRNFSRATIVQTPQILHIGLTLGPGNVRYYCWSWKYSTSKSKKRYFSVCVGVTWWL